MDGNSLPVLAIACSIAALATSLVVALRSTPQRVRKAAQTALEMVEETQNAFQLIRNQCVSFMDEVTRERASAAADLQEAERKRRQAAAKLSKLNKGEGEAFEQPQSLGEALASLAPGDPRRLTILRRAKMAASGDT